MRLIYRTATDGDLPLRVPHLELACGSNICLANPYLTLALPRQLVDTARTWRRLSAVDEFLT